MRGNPTAARNLAFSGVRLSICVLACNSIGGMFILVIPMSCTISASTPISYSSLMSFSTAGTSSSYIMVLSVTNTFAPKMCAYSTRCAISSTEFPAAWRAPNCAAPIYTASAPWSIAAIPVSQSFAGASSSILHGCCIISCRWVVLGTKIQKRRYFFRINEVYQHIFY